MGLALAGGVAGCGLESADGGGTGGTGGTADLPERIPNTEDPAYDQRLDDLEIVCASTLLVSGTFEQTQERPADVENCWAAGIWRVTAQLDFQGCDPQPAFAETYEFDVTVDEDLVTTIYDVNDPENERVNFTITQDGSSTCNGSFEYFGTNNHVVSIKPRMDNATNTMSGAGEYTVYSFNPF